MESFMKYCLRYCHLLTKFGQRAELLERILRSWTCCPKSVMTVPADLVIFTLKQEKLPQKLDTRATSLLQKIQFRQCRIPHRRATSTLQKIKAQKARMEGNLHSIAGETMHQTRPAGRKDKMHTGQTGGHLAHHSKALGKRGRRTVSAL